MSWLFLIGVTVILYSVASTYQRILMKLMVFLGDALTIPQITGVVVVSS